MKILTRYILRQHIGPFIFGFSIITLIWILNLLFKELNRILSKGLPAHIVFEFFLLNLAWIVALTVPMAILIATLMAFGRLSADNEITAIKANGISLYRVLVPVILAASLVALFLVWFNNNVLPDFNHRLATLLRDIAKKKPTLNIEAGVWYDELNPYGLIVATIEDSGKVSRVTDVLIKDNSDRNVINTISAKRGKLRVNESAGLLEITLYDGEIQQVDILHPEEFQRLVFPDSHIVRINIVDQFLQRSESSYRSDREKSAQQLGAEVKELRRKIADKKRAIELLAGTQFKKYLGSRFGLPAPSPADSTIISTLSLRSRTALRRQGPSPPPLRQAKGSGGRNGRSGLDARILRGQLLAGQKSVLTDIRASYSQIKSHRNRINKYLVEYYKKYSIPVACIIFVLIGAPLGIKVRKGNIGMGAGISLFFFLVYWTFLISGEDLADRGKLSPFLAMWLANFIVGAAGLYILYVTVRETEIINFQRLLARFRR